MPEVPSTMLLVKGAERYILVFDWASRSEAMRTLGRWASNPELVFSWYDAAVMSKAIREAVIEHVESQNSSKEATMLFIGFRGGPWDGEVRTYLRPQPAMTELSQPGSSTLFIYRLYQTPHGLRYIFDKAYRPATQDSCGK